MAKATQREWQTHAQWQPMVDGVRKSPYVGIRTDPQSYENYTREYDRISNTMSDNALREWNDAHGFTPGVAGGEPAVHHAPKGGGESEGMGQMASMFADLMAKYDTLLEGFLNQSAEPGASQADGGMGFEDTVLTRRVLPDEETRRPGVTPTAAPQRRVIDPATGATYASPAAALAAGVTSWRYVPVGEE